MLVQNNTANLVIKARSDLDKLQKAIATNGINSAKTKKILSDLLDQRGMLMDSISDALKIIKLIEESVKNLNLNKGTYGSRYVLKVKAVQAKRIIDEHQFLQLVKSKNLNPLLFCKVDDKNPNTKHLIEQHPELLYEDSNVIHRHYF